MVIAKLSHNSLSAILLDLDDTILIDDAISKKAWLTVCDKFAPLAGGPGAAEIYRAIKEIADKYWSDPENHRRGRLDLKNARRHVVSMAFSSLGLKNMQLASDLADMFSFEKNQAITPFNGAIETLQALKDRGLRLALLTNGSSENQRSKIRRFGLEVYFDCILIEGEFGVGKPDERIFLSALEHLNASSSQAWMVGNDLDHDIAGAQKAGLYTVWVDIKAKGLPPASTVQPDRIIREINQLLS
jgi:putative hydrolase of the HAD superfamily